MNRTAPNDVPAQDTRLDKNRRPARARILLIEDDQDIAEGIIGDLSDRSYTLTHSTTGGEGARQAREGHYDLLIVDVMLPDGDGVTLIRDLRQEDFRVPVLFISALSAVTDRIRGLKSGGDDYVTKPFALAEVAARVEALLRRPVETRATVLHVGPLELDLIERVVRRGDHVASLSRSEFKLLEYFMRRPDRVITRNMLLEDVWDYRVVPQTNLVDVHIGQLRRKIGDTGGEPMLLSVRGVGFILRDPG